MEAVETYIATQDEHHHHTSTTEEFDALLKKHWTPAPDDVSPARGL